MKKIAAIISLFLSFFAFAEEYKIVSVDYEIDGSTRLYAMETKVPIDLKKKFQSEEELITYIEDIKKQLENTRTFDEVDYSYEIEESDDGETLGVKLLIKTKDSLHFIGTPYPKYKSGDSLSLLLKVKDTNFLGSMETLTADLNFGIELDDDDKAEEYKFGFNADFDTPFKLSAMDAVWGNNLSFSYTIGDSSPEWNYKTGLSLVLPFNKFSLVWAFDQSFVRNFDYKGEWKGEGDNREYFDYGDDTYFIESFKFSVPITIQEVKNWGKILYTPYTKVTYNWDFDGISKDNEDLLGPSMEFGQTISTARINWIENFRNGIDVSITQSFEYNFNDYNFNPGISGEFKAYKTFGWMGFCTDIYAYAYMNGNGSFGDRMRGIRPDQYYDIDDLENVDPEIAFLKPCKSAAAIIINMDFPIKICRIYWDTIPVIKKIKVAKYFNLEAQISPFIDIALFKNEAMNSTFNPKDGFISGGIEGIIYPLRWKGIQVRGSLGVDLTRKMPKLKGKVNQDWRSSCKSYEISIGIGLHY